MQRENLNEMKAELDPATATQTNTKVSIIAPPSSSTLSEIKYSEEVRFAQAKRQHKNKALRQSPETLIADYTVLGECRVKSNLLFYTQHPTAWHTALCKTYPCIRKRGSSPTQQLRDEVTRFKTQHRAGVQELRAVMRGLEENIQTLKTEPRRVREERPGQPSTTT
ncbi:UNVERIFIED_CONTAM: hypothetical protein FKN15_026301 [Acipenser sinensis]